MNKFIFIWIPKNAGTTISSCLQDLHMCRGKDLITSYSQKHESDLKDKILQGLHEHNILSFGHVDIFNLKKYEINLDFSKITTFAVIRNTYSRAVSLYTYILRDIASWVDKYNILPASALQSFSHFINYIHDNERDPVGFYNCLNLSFTQCQTDWLNGSVDFLLDFDNIKLEINNLAKNTGIKVQNIPHKNCSNKDNYKKYYDSDTKKIVESVFKNDLEYFHHIF